MRALLTSLILPALTGLLLVLPFMIMEAANRRSYNEGFPLLLFFIMWLLPVIFVFLLKPIVRKIRAGNSILESPLKLFSSATILTVIAIAWTAALIDQMPCFLGVPNCD